MEVVVWGSVGLGKGFGFHSEFSGKPLEGSEQGMTRPGLGLRSSRWLLDGEQTPGAQ